MKVPSLLACAMATVALAACNKNSNEAPGGAAANETVAITQANPPR
jgi:hypothetical protein